MARGDFSAARSKLPARLISTRHPILRITTLSARCESLLSREPFAVSYYRLCQTSPMRFSTQKPYRKTLERRGQESQEPRKLRLCALLFRYNWKDRAENKGQGQFMAALPNGGIRRERKGWTSGQIRGKKRKRARENSPLSEASSRERCYQHGSESPAAREKGAPIYTTTKGVRGLVFGVYIADMYTGTAGTSMIRTLYVRTCIYIVVDAGDHACARAHVRVVRPEPRHRHPPPPPPPFSTPASLSAPSRPAMAPTARKYTPISRPCYPRIPQFVHLYTLDNPNNEFPEKNKQKATLL
ncbi:hypothetical protein ALC60_11015 [Trachymyrmex zeteki]|uniref:Uncharacterized protein n=1 Tax=Mycetomoellerius zeteki TaxID=64791 RepID=A0A151WPT4_9HYME|nr:hypothetical protein ALC60_11015 [Trachymyrmex zeteki]